MDSIEAQRRMMECDQVVKVSNVAIANLSPMFIPILFFVETEHVPQKWKAFRPVKLYEADHGKRW